MLGYMLKKINIQKVDFRNISTYQIFLSIFLIFNSNFFKNLSFDFYVFFVI